MHAYNYVNLTYRMGQLTWHNGLIPQGEVWVKIGGDKGGTTLKASFQLCNIAKPNSYQNSVFAIFEARDSPTNLHIALDRYEIQIRALQTLQWRYAYTYMYNSIIINSHDAHVHTITEENTFEFSCLVTTNF